MTTEATTKTTEDVLTMDEIATSPDVEYATVEAWGGKKVRIASVTAGDMIEWSEASEGEAKRTAGIRLIIKSLVDKEGKRIANDAHISMFRAKSHKITENVVKAILKLNGLSVKEGDAAKKD